MFETVRNAVLEKHAKRLDDNRWSIPHANAEAFASALNEAGSAMVDVDAELVGLLSAEKLCGAKITPNDLEILSQLF
jgi:hypothetical protein